MHHLLDGTFNGMGGSELYRRELVPDLFPHQKAMRIENWSDDDREMYVGGEYTPGYQERRSLIDAVFVPAGSGRFA